ncbi:uncharacterized protein DNG_03743 [Cephalotrichum gorgonifer]|uniref:Uncharacterized protein n=1 Tax=Cephalotrichum gorgonifer TaxID=2041049 RepID=A0AAE8MUQ8_9PEZI|nr:uncharacterized protein DNG_03743 [Cephalotrichum gorgonifer]
MADVICSRKPLLAKPGHHIRRRARLNHQHHRRPARLDSAIYIDEHDAPAARGCQDGRGRAISRRRYELESPEWTAAGGRPLRAGGSQLLPCYNPKPLLHREDAFKVVEAPPDAIVAAAAVTTTMPAMLCSSAPKTGPGLHSDDDGDSTEYDSDELELGTTQFPEFGEDILDDMDNYRPQRDYSYSYGFNLSRPCF